MFINGPYNKIALQTGDSSAGCGVIVKRMVMMKENRKLDFDDLMVWCDPLFCDRQEV